jgi:hypothetical protein
MCMDERVSGIKGSRSYVRNLNELPKSSLTLADDNGWHRLEGRRMKMRGECRECTGINLRVVSGIRSRHLHVYPWEFSSEGHGKRE